MELQKHTLNLRAGDYEYLDSLFGSQGLKAAVVIRTIVSRSVDHYRKQETPIDFTLGVSDD